MPVTCLCPCSEEFSDDGAHDRRCHVPVGVAAREFVRLEDPVRDVAGALRADPRIEAFAVESENFESIHSHSTCARPEGRAEAAV